MIYFCCDNERRANAVLAHPALNGIDFLEVSDDPDNPIDKRQRTLSVHFLKDLTPGALKEDNIRIEGGERIKNIRVSKVTVAAVTSPTLSPSAPDSKVLVVEVSERGDFSPYLLRLVKDANSNEPPVDFDPILSVIEFSFKVACPSDFDCKADQACPTKATTEPEINYLAKDYASFRQLMLDRMALLSPRWRERNAADLGIALVELLAFVGDYLSYQQDAVATEAYLSTARRRSSIRRHARLVDYPMHDGRNARVWVHINVASGGDGLTLEKGAGRNRTKLLTKAPDQSSAVISQNSAAFERALNSGLLVFELLHDITLFEAHNEMKFYTWEARDCCLPKGATRATLRDDGNTRIRLRAGDVLIFEERKGPQTGVKADADPAHRHAVLLTHVYPAAKLTVVNDKPLRTPGDLVTDPLTALPVVQIEWARADALPFPLCISADARTGFNADVSVALGNIVLADHGMTFSDEPETKPFDLENVSTSLDADTVPDPNRALTAVSISASDRCNAVAGPVPAARYRPRLTQGPLTHAAPFDPSASSAARAMKLSTKDPLQFPLPCIWLSRFTDHADPEIWLPVRDLLESHANSKEFVVEVEADGAAYLRFGDDRLGSRPVSGAKFLATYRVGNGASGNIGADTLAHLVSSSLSDSTAVTEVRNPLRAEGGIDAETIEAVRQNAPSAFRIQERAVTAADYEGITIRKEVAERCDLDAQRAAATLRWTGSWHTMFVTVDRFGGRQVDQDFERKVRGCLERFRMAGQDLEVDGPRYVSLEIELAVCIQPGYFFSDVEQALLDVFSDRILPDGRRGVFHPDNFTFGQTVYLSSLIAAAQAVAGVDSVIVRKFQRQHIDSQEAMTAGKLELGRLEIARLNNDPNFPERGSFKVTHG
jgi:hypothetical protein